MGQLILFSSSTTEMNSGHVVISLSVVYFVVASYAILFSAFIPLTGIYVRFLVTQCRKGLLNRSHQALDVLAQDTHYKYFVMLIIPMSIYFVIANWVGWQYYRNS
jgi:hypothetical protein